MIGKNIPLYFSFRVFWIKQLSRNSVLILMILRTNFVGILANRFVP